jgi:hypothetical protein
MRLLEGLSENIPPSWKPLDPEVADSECGASFPQLGYSKSSFLQAYQPAPDPERESVTS